MSSSLYWNNPLHLHVHCREVAVILGGVNNKGAHLEIPEIYTPWPLGKLYLMLFLLWDPQHCKINVVFVLLLEILKSQVFGEFSRFHGI